METGMTSRLVAGLMVAGLGLGLSGCALYAPSAGNPNGDAYLGNPGSSYEAAVNPARTVGEVAYSPSAPLPQTAQPAAPITGPMPAPATRRHQD